MAAPEPRRRLDEFDVVTLAETDFIVGYRPGAKGIRFPIADLAELINPAPLGFTPLSIEEADTRYVQHETANELFLRRALAESLYPTKAEIAETYLTKVQAMEAFVRHEEMILYTESGRGFRIAVVDDPLAGPGQPDVRIIAEPV